LDVYLFCAVDPSRFDHLLEIPQRDLLGYIVMVDSAHPDTWGEARIMMANCRGYALLPTLIAANKQDLPGAAAPEQVGASIGMDNMTGVQPCIATDSQSARNVFLQLLYLVKREIDRLDALIAEIERMMTQNAPTQE
jgi:signal recognition particle receptor subunit beta